MADKHIADGESSFRVICSAPDVCRVSKEIVPFDSYQQLSSKKSYSPNVAARGVKVLTVGSVIDGSQGNAGSGVASGTSGRGGDCRVLTGSPTCNANGKPVARHDDSVAVNNANTVGKLNTGTGVPLGSVNANGVPCNNPPKRSKRLDDLEAFQKQLKDSPLNPDQLDEIIRFEDTDKIISEQIAGIQPGADSWGATKIAAGVTRGTLSVLKRGVLGLGELLYSGAKAAANPTASLQASLKGAILAENIKLGNVCYEGMKQGLVALKDAAIKKAEEGIEAWNKGDIGKKSEIVTNVVGEIALLFVGAGEAKAAVDAGKGVRLVEDAAELRGLADAKKLAEAQELARGEERVRKLTELQNAKKAEAVENAAGKKPAAEPNAEGKKATPAEEKKTSGAKVEPKRMKEFDPGCFTRGNPKTMNKGEYENQLKMQEKALNKMTVGEYEKARDAFRDKATRAGIEKTSASARAAARKEFEKSLNCKYLKELNAQGTFGLASKQQAAACVKAAMNGLDALHELDSVMGGDAGKVLMLGPSGPNRSIGTQMSSRAKKLDDEIRGLPKDAMLNVKLAECK